MAEDKRTPEEHNGAPAQTQRSGPRGGRRDSGTSELSSENGSERYGACPDEGYTPASPVKRTLAWIGVVYAVILLALTTYIYFTGTALGNLGPLLTVPGLIGLGVVVLVSWRSTGRPPKGSAIALAALCWLLALAALPMGIIGLMSNFSDFVTVFGVSVLGR